MVGIPPLEPDDGLGVISLAPLRPKGYVFVEAGPTPFLLACGEE